MSSARTLIFHIADKQGRPSIRTTDQDYARFMEAQGWKVTDVEFSAGLQ